MKSVEIKKYYNKRYSTNKIERPQKFYKKLISLIPQKKGRLLDVGCGTGMLLYFGELSGISSYGVDISEVAVNLARKRLGEKRAKIKVASAEKIPYKNNFFDYVFCIGTLEHFSDIRKGLKEISRVSNRKTRFYFLVPNSKFLLWMFTKEKGTEQPQEKILSLEEWSDVFEKEGFEILDIKKDVGPLTNKLIKNTIFTIGIKILPVKLTYQFLFTLKKK
ncbi:MAG: putative methyltransferase YcgJ [Parcubacteria group bacterium ADurb.Bin159]|nr:MAG: putative methyltransferase YcgJ [Parcubacteria group bacterium ADurb.Bin159]